MRKRKSGFGKERRKRRACSLRGLGHLSNLKFKSFENAADRHEVVPGGKQIFTVSLIHAEERLIDIVHAARLFFLREEKYGRVIPAVPQTHAIWYLRSRCVSFDSQDSSYRTSSLNINTSFAGIFAKPSCARNICTLQYSASLPDQTSITFRNTRSTRCRGTTDNGSINGEGTLRLKLISTGLPRRVNFIIEYGVASTVYTNVS